MESSPVDKKPILSADGTVIQNSSESSTTLRSSNVNSTATPGEGILPVLYEIIRCVEKDPLDNATKQREGAECSQKILELQKRVEAARAQIKQLPGIDFNQEEQLQQLEQLRNQLKSKQNLLRKYKDTQF